MSRTALTRHPTRTVPAVITGLIITALGVGVLWASITRVVTQSWPGLLTTPTTAIAALTWSSVTMIIIAVALAVLGLVAIVCGLKPGAPTTLPVTLSGVVDTEMVMGRRSVARLSTALADVVDGVDQVTAIASRRRVRLVVRTPTDDDPGAVAEIRSAVTQQVTAGLVSTGLTPTPAVSVTVRSS